MKELQAIDTAHLEAAADRMADDLARIGASLEGALRIGAAPFETLLSPKLLADLDQMEKVMKQVTKDIADLCRMSILDFRDRPIKPLDIPEWNGRLYVRPISLGEREALSWEFKGLDKNGELAQQFKARLFVACVVDKKTGRPMFTADDVPALVDKSAAAIERVLLAMSDLFG